MQLSAQTAGKREREENQNGSTLTKKSVLVPCERTPSRLCRYTELHERHRPRLFACIFCNFSSYSRSLLLSLSLLSSSSFCPRLSCPRRSPPRSFFSPLSRHVCVECASSFDDKDDSFLHSLEPVSFLLLFLLLRLLLFLFFIRPNPLLCRLFIIIIVSLRIYYISLLLLMLMLLMDCGESFYAK